MSAIIPLFLRPEVLTSAVSSANSVMPSSFNIPHNLSTIAPESTCKCLTKCSTKSRTISSDLSGESILPNTLIDNSHPSLAVDSPSYSASACAYCTSVESLMPSTSSGVGGPMPSSSKSFSSKSSSA
jgi:hypothetical protein